MSKFSVGDKVVCVHRVEGNWYKVGDQLTIRRVAGEKFDDGRRYNAYNTTDCDDNGVWIEEADFELVGESIQKPILEERKLGKVKMQLFDEGFPNAVMEIAKVMSWAEQNKGYKPNDFKNLPNADVEFSAAASRHKLKGLIQKDAGLPPLERVDEESGIVHLAHVAFNILAELELVLTGRIKE